jgi:hypothetical protein
MIMEDRVSPTPPGLGQLPGPPVRVGDVLVLPDGRLVRVVDVEAPAVCVTLNGATVRLPIEPTGVALEVDDMDPS